MAGVVGPSTNPTGHGSRKNSFTNPSGTPGWPKDKSAHVCPTCQRGFSRSEHLERHMATHLPSADSKIFICSHCTKGFSRKDVLIRHVRAVHETPKAEVKRSRRRSCQRCAGFKIKCSGGSTRPFGVIGACEACKKRKVECIFDIDPTQQDVQQNGLAPGKRWAEKSKSRRFSDAVLEPPSSMADRMARGEPALKRRRTIDDPQTVIIGGGPPRLDPSAGDREDVSHHLLSAALMFSDDNGMSGPNVDGLLRAASFSQPGMMGPPDYPNDNKLQPMVLDPRLAGDYGDRPPSAVSPTMEASPTGTRVIGPDGYEQPAMYLPEVSTGREMSSVYGQGPQMGADEGYQNGLLSVPEEDYPQMQIKNMDEEIGPLDTVTSGVEGMSQPGPSLGGDWRSSAADLPTGNVQEQSQIGVERGMRDLELNPEYLYWGGDQSVDQPVDQIPFDAWYRDSGEDGRMGPFDRHPRNTGDFQRSNNATPGLPGTPTLLQPPDSKFTFSNRFMRVNSPGSEVSQDDGGNAPGYLYRSSTPLEGSAGDASGAGSLPWAAPSQDRGIKLPPIRNILLDEYSSPRGGNPSSRRSSYGQINYSSDPAAASLSAGRSNDQARREVGALRSV